MNSIFKYYLERNDHHFRLVITVPGYRSRGPGSIRGATRFSEKQWGLKRGPLSLVSTLEELLGRKVAAAVQEAENMAVGIRHVDQAAPSIHKSLY
jgi:hypothetical protein